MRRAALLVTAAAALATASPAHALIVPQKGIRGVRLLDSVQKVRDRLGAPDAVIFSRHPIIGRVRTYKYGLTYVGFNGAGADAKVQAVSTTSRRERTSRGVGVGTRRGLVAARVPRAKCSVEFGVDHCYVGSFRAGTRVTDFRIGANGRVTGVVVGFVVD